MGDSEEETAEEKRLRLAKKYLEEIERQGINLLDVRLYYYNQNSWGYKNTLFKYITILNVQYLEKERIGELTEAQNENQGIETAVNLRLRRDDLEESGKLTRLVAHNYENITHEELADIPRIQILRDHKGNIELCVEMLIFKHY